MGCRNEVLGRAVLHELAVEVRLQSATPRRSRAGRGPARSAGRADRRSRALGPELAGRQPNSPCRNLGLSHHTVSSGCDSRRAADRGGSLRATLLRPRDPSTAEAPPTVLWEAWCGSVKLHLGRRRLRLLSGA